MALERGRVILPIIAKNRPIFGKAGTVAQQKIPVEMTDLMPEMAEQRPIGLVHIHPCLLPLGIIGLAQINGDEPARMTGDDRAWHPGIIGKEIESEAGRALRQARQRQPQADQLIDEAVLGAFQPLPCVLMSRIGEIGNSPIVATGAAKPIDRIRGHKPVANAVRRIRAKAERPAPSLPDREPERWIIAHRRLQRTQEHGFGIISQGGTAALAQRILEKKQLAASLALEQPHMPIPWSIVARKGMNWG